MQKIYHQGFFDGACFLYSIVNGYSALVNKPIDQSMWEEAMKWIPFRSDYISDVGTQRSDNDFNLYKFTIHRLLREFKNGRNIVVTEHTSITKKEQIHELVNEKSVVILNISRDHWIVVVDYDDRHLKAVCSSQLIKKEGSYKEFDCSITNRRYNFKKQYGKLGWIYQSKVISLTNA